MATPLKLRLVRWMSAICVCLSLDACSQPVDQANLSQIHAIAVASACGREITRASIAFLAFGNEITKGDISEWGMDDLAVGIVQDSLPGNIQVRKAEFDAAKLAAANGALLFNPWSSNAVRPEPGVDAYLLITPAPAGGGGR